MGLHFGMGLGATLVGASVSVEFSTLADGSPEVTANGATATITISGSSVSAYNDTFVITIADLASGPVNLVAPGISGTAGVGETLTRDYEGLWVYEGETAPVITAIWQSDGSDITGETATTFDVTATEAETDVTYEETATQSGTGARSQDSNAISIPAAPADPVTALSTALGSKLWAAYDLTDFANMARNDDGTGAAVTAGAPVEWLVDGSGNGRHLTTSGVNVSSFPNAVAQTGYLDMNDCGFRLAAAPSGLTTTMEVYAVIDLDGDTSCMLVGHNNNSSNFAGAAQDGSSSGTDANLGSPSYTIDGSAPSGSDRNALYDDLFAAGGYATFGVEAVDLTVPGQDFLPMGYNGSFGTFGFSGRVRMIVVTTALTAGNRTTTQSILDGVK